MKTLIEKSARQAGLHAVRLNQTHTQMNEQFESIIEAALNGDPKRGCHEFCELTSFEQQDFLYYVRGKDMDQSQKSTVFIKLLIGVTADSGKS